MQRGKVHFAGHDDGVHAGELQQYRGQQGQQASIENYDLILGVVADVDKLIWVRRRFRVCSTAPIEGTAQ